MMPGKTVMLCVIAQRLGAIHNSAAFENCGWLEKRSKEMTTDNRHFTKQSQHILSVGRDIDIF